MRRYCDYCNQWMEFKNYQSFASHKGNCRKAPFYEDKREKIRRAAKKQWKVKEYKIKCKNCRKEYKLEITENAYNKDNYKKFCCVKCSIEWRNNQQEKYMECPYCGGFYKTRGNGIMNHIWRVHTKEGRKFKSVGNKNSPWNKGLTKETSEILAKQAKQISKTTKGRKRYSPTKETREKIRKAVLTRIERGWINKQCGRAKKYTYESLTNGKIKVDGTWELKVAKYLDKIGVKWKRNDKRFKYQSKIKGRESIYIPDFYVYDWKTYIEVKGYKTDLDGEKWSQFPEPLVVWDREKLEELGILRGP